MRAPFQVLVLPYRWKGGNPEFLILKDKECGFWVFVAGGGEDDETLLEAARRECQEETSLVGNLTQLDSLATIPKNHFLGTSIWPEDIYVIPEYSFSLAADEGEVMISLEHTEFCWVPFQEGTHLLKWDSNRNALWELSQRLKVKD
jgi:dATP pyrophosphohydrolase